MQELRLAEWTQQLAGLVVLASCAAMATSAPKPRVGVLPAVAISGKPEGKSRKKGGLSPEVLEFMRLPPHIQRQVLDYARNWLDASFERSA